MQSSLGRDRVRMQAASTALDMIRQLQKRETHPFLRSSFSMIEGEEEFIPYPSMKKEKAKNQKERGEAR